VADMMHAHIYAYAWIRCTWTQAHNLTHTYHYAHDVPEGVGQAISVCQKSVSDTSLVCQKSV